MPRKHPASGRGDARDGFQSPGRGSRNRSIRQPVAATGFGEKLGFRVAPVGGRVARPSHRLAALGNEIRPHFDLVVRDIGKCRFRLRRCGRRDRLGLGSGSGFFGFRRGNRGSGLDSLASGSRRLGGRLGSGFLGRAGGGSRAGFIGWHERRLLKRDVFLQNKSSNFFLHERTSLPWDHF